MKKRPLFGTFAACMLLASLIAGCAPRTETVVILSTNDMHSRIESFPQLAAAVKACRDTMKNVILADAGDRWTGNVYCDRAAEPRKPIIDLMNLLRYDVATFGNHEFDAGQAFLGTRVAQCDFPVVCANIVSDTATFPQPAPYVIIERGGKRIGFVGTVTNYDRNNHPAGKDESFVGLTFTDAVASVAEYEALRDECDALVALTHIGTIKDRELADAAPRYDVILGGHSHDETDELVNGVLVTQTGKYLRNIGVTTLTFRDDELVDKEFRLVSLDAYKPSATYQRMIDGYYSDPSLRAKVADLRGAMDKTGLANVFTEGVKEAGKADIGIYHIGGVRLDTLVREVVVADIYNLDPFGSKLVTAEMTADDLARLVKTKYNDMVNLDESHRVDIYMTTPYVIHTNDRNEAVRVEFPDLKRGRRYRVAMGDYIFKNYADLKYTRGEITETLITDVLDSYFRNRSPFLPDNSPRQRIE